MTPRSWLFVPGDKPELMAKAFASGADAVIVDLEDAVLEDNKARARDLVATFAKNLPPTSSQLWIRINPLQTKYALHDLAAVVPGGAVGIVLPKADSVAAVIELGYYLSALETAAGHPVGKTGILPIATETPKSVFELGSYAASGPRLAGLTWGAEDLPVAVGAAEVATSAAPSPRFANWRGRCALRERPPRAWRPSIPSIPLSATSKDCARTQ